MSLSSFVCPVIFRYIVTSIWHLNTLPPLCLVSIVFASFHPDTTCTLPHLAPPCPRAYLASPAWTCLVSTFTSSPDPWSHGHGSFLKMNNPHDYLITTPTPSRPVDPDNADSWVMLNQGGFVKLGNERILQKLDSRISCDLSVPSELRTRCTAFHRKSDRGTLFLTNKRVCGRPTSRDTTSPHCLTLVLR